MDPNDPAAETANLIASWALAVALFAAVVSLVAAGFAGWQAVTAHLERTRPRPAAFVLPPVQVGAVRKIKNEGGSSAHNVRVFAWAQPVSRRSRRDAVRRLTSSPTRTPKLLGEPITGGRVHGSLPAGETARIVGFGPRAEMFGPPRKGRGAGGLDILYSPALVLWIDARGAQRHAWLELR